MSNVRIVLFVNKTVIHFFDYLFLLRIPLLAPVWTIVLLGWLTASPLHRLGGLLGADSGEMVPQMRLWMALLFFSLVVASIYVVNQIADVESDRVNNKLFLLPRSIIPLNHAWVVAALCAVGGMAGGWWLGRIEFVLFALSLLLGAMYNLAPFRLKDRPWGGWMANLLGHGVLTYLIGWYALHEHFTAHSLLCSLSPGFANAAVYLATTIPDAPGDEATGKRTFCVAYGPRVTAIVAALCCLGALVSAFFMLYHRWLMIAPAALSLVVFTIFAIVPRPETAFKAFKWPVLILTVLVGVMQPLYVVLIAAVFWGSKVYYRHRFNLDYPSFKST